MQYVILAAGQGSRFAKEGITTPKPMVEINGRPMIERLISILLSCGGERVYVATNSAMTSLNEELRHLRDDLGWPVIFHPIVSDNSFYSLQCACEGVEGRFVAMTCDAIFPTEEFRRYVEEIERSPEQEAIMALTTYVDDESPLYAKLSADGKQIVDYHYGGKPFEGQPVIVSAGVYAITPELLATAQRDGYPESLSDFQRILANRPDISVRPFVFSKAFDVDCSHDRLEAESFVREVNGECTK